MTVSLRNHLLIGRDLARTMGELSESLGLPRRILEAAVQQARLDGVPIVSGSEGLWIATSPEEVARAAETLNGRVMTQYRTVRAMRATARRMRAQGVEQGTLGLVA